MSGRASITAPEVHNAAGSVIQRCLKIKDYSERCTASVIITILLYAASRVTSLSDACDSLRQAPSDETLRKGVLASLPGRAALERQINRALSKNLPKALRKRSQRLAIDMHEVPYHGQPEKERREIRRGKPSHGTSHFHCYATAYVVRKGYRFTLAMTWVRQDDPLEEVLKRLLQQVRRCGVKIRFLLLDRGFYSADVVRYLQAARCPFLMPLKAAGRLPKDPEKAALSARRFFQWKHSGWSQHTWCNPQGRRATVNVCVSCRNHAGENKRSGRYALVYAYWGLHPTSTNWVRATYRKRFGIEASYRQLNQARIRTSTRKAILRLLFVGLALILRNAWVWLHLIKFAERHGTGVTLHLEKLRFRRLLLEIQRFVESLFHPSPPEPSSTSMTKNTYAHPRLT